MNKIVSWSGKNKIRLGFPFDRPMAVQTKSFLQNPNPWWCLYPHKLIFSLLWGLLGLYHWKAILLLHMQLFYHWSPSSVFIFHVVSDRSPGEFIGCHFVQKFVFLQRWLFPALLSPSGVSWWIRAWRPARPQSWQVIHDDAKLKLVSVKNWPLNDCWNNKYLAWSLLF